MDQKIEGKLQNKGILFPKNEFAFKVKETISRHRIEKEVFTHKIEQEIKKLEQIITQLENDENEELINHKVSDLSFEALNKYNVLEKESYNNYLMNPFDNTKTFLSFIYFKIGYFKFEFNFDKENSKPFFLKALKLNDSNYLAYLMLGEYFAYFEQYEDLKKLVFMIQNLKPLPENKKTKEEIFSYLAGRYYLYYEYLMSNNHPNFRSIQHLQKALEYSFAIQPLTNARYYLVYIKMYPPGKGLIYSLETLTKFSKGAGNRLFGVYYLRVLKSFFSRSQPKKDKIKSIFQFRKRMLFHFSKALEYNPRDYQCLESFADALELMKLKKVSGLLIKDAISLRGSVFSFGYIARYAFAKKDYSTCIENSEKALKCPSQFKKEKEILFSKLYYNISTCFRFMEKNEKAVANYKNCIEFNKLDDLNTSLKCCFHVAALRLKEFSKPGNLLDGWNHLNQFKGIRELLKKENPNFNCKYDAEASFLTSEYLKFSKQYEKSLIELQDFKKEMMKTPEEFSPIQRRLFGVKMDLLVLYKKSEIFNNSLFW